MKVLYGYRYGILGGVCTQLLNRLQVLDGSNELEAHLLFSRDYGISRTLDGYPHLYFESDPGKVRALATAGGYDAFVVIDTPEYAQLLGEFKDVPLIVEVHTTTDNGLRYLNERTWRAAGYIVPSDYSRRLLRERFDLTEAPIHIVPNSLDVRLFPYIEVSPTLPRPTFAWIGKLDDHKNWRGFLRIAQWATRQGLDAEYWLIGGETAPEDRQQELIDEIENFELHTRCRWFPRIEYRAMHRVYAAIRQSGGAAVVTSINESFGMSVLEALMCGCPVLASRVGALPEIMPQRDYLKFYELDDTPAAAESVVEMARPAEGKRLRQLLADDRKELLARYSHETVACQYLQVLRQLIG